MTAARLLVVDGQALQTPAWHRGIGKYSLALLEALVAGAAPGSLDLRVVLSAHLEDDGRAERLRDLLPGATVDVLDLRWSESAHGETADHNRAVVDAYLAGMPVPAEGSPTFLTLCQLLDLTLCVVPSDGRWRRLVVVYDLIPFMFHRQYLRTAVARERYLGRVAEMLRADRFLAISQTVAADVTLQLGVDPARVDVLVGGPIAHHTSSPGAAAGDGEDPPYVLMPSGNDPRKNNRLAILGFARFNARHGDRYRLRITSHFEPHERADLGDLAAGVEFTGNVDGSTMDALYRNAAALLFAPEYEGLGLPVLEAVEVSRPIACSDIAVFRELSSTAFATFDPHSVSGIGDALERAVGAEVDAVEYARITARHTWAATARQLAAALDAPHRPAPASRPVLTVVAPDPSASDGAGAAAQIVHAELVRRAEVRYLVPDRDTARIDRTPRPDLLGHVGPAAPWDAPAVVHLGAEPSTLPYALANHDGTLVLHAASLAATWDAAVAAGVVHASRLDLERRLDDLAGGDGTLLVGVLARVRHVLTVDDAVHAAVTRVVAGLEHPPAVTPWPRPVGVPAATGDVATRRVSLARASRPPVALTDRERDDARRAVACVLTGDPAPEHELLALLRLGAVPVDSAAAAAALLADPARWSEASAASRRAVAERHGATVAAAALLAAVTGTG